MSKFSCVQGATSQSVNVFVRDSSSGIGAGLASVAPAGGSLLSGTKLDYSFTGANAARVNVGLAVLATVGSAYSSAGIVQIDNTNMIGWVRIDIPNAALAGSTNRVVSFLLWGGTNMAPTPFEIELTAVNNQSATAFITGVNSLAPPTNWNAMAITAAGGVAPDWANVKSPTTTVGLTGTTISTTQVVASVSGAVGSVTGLTASNLDTTVSSRLAPTVAARTLDVSAGGEAGVDWANVGSPTTTVGLTGTTISSAQVVASVTTAVAVTSNIKKNQALSGFEFPMFDTTDHVTPLPGLTVTAQRSIDGAAFGACTNSPTAISGGYYTINFAAADLNGNSIIFKFTATGADATVVTVVTQP